MAHRVVFVCYAEADQAWAEWIAWQLSGAGYDPRVEIWDAVPGTNWPSWAQQAVAEADHTLVLLSPEAMQSALVQAQWQAAFEADRDGLMRRLIPVVVGQGSRPGLLAGHVRIDLFSLAEAEARAVLLDGMKAAGTGHRRPVHPPPFPGPGRIAGGPPFPGTGNLRHRQREVSSEIPGGAMTSRSIHFFWLLDCSGSMEADGKIGQLNLAIREAIPEIQRVAADNPVAKLLLRVITFASHAAWHISSPTPVDDFYWSDVSAAGATDLGAALTLVASELEEPPMPRRALRPVLALVSDGQPTDDWRSGLRAVDETPWGMRAIRVAIAIGKDADRRVLKEFLHNPELEPIEVNNPRALASAIRWASSVALKATVRPRSGANQDLLVPPAVEDIW